MSKFLPQLNKFLSVYENDLFLSIPVPTFIKWILTLIDVNYSGFLAQHFYNSVSKMFVEFIVILKFTNCMRNGNNQNSYRLYSVTTGNSTVHIL